MNNIYTDKILYKKCPTEFTPLCESCESCELALLKKAIMGSVNLLFVFHHLTKRESGSIMWKELGNRRTKETQVHLLFSKSELPLTHVNSRGHSCYKDVFEACEQLLEKKTTNVTRLTTAFDISQNIFEVPYSYFQIGCCWQHINMLAFLNRAVSGTEPSQGQWSMCWNQKSTRSPLMKALN